MFTDVPCCLWALALLVVVHGKPLQALCCEWQQDFWGGMLIVVCKSVMNVLYMGSLELLLEEQFLYTDCVISHP